MGRKTGAEIIVVVSKMDQLHLNKVLKREKGFTAYELGFEIKCEAFVAVNK